MEGARIEAVRMDTQPDYMSLARLIVEELDAFFKDPDIEKEYQQWLKENGGEE